MMSDGAIWQEERFSSRSWNLARGVPLIFAFKA
jgi:hypothetical protein